MLAKIVDLTNGNFGKMDYMTIDTYNLEQTIWDCLSQDLYFSHIFYILCNFHDL